MFPEATFVNPTYPQPGSHGGGSQDPCDASGGSTGIHAPFTSLSRLPKLTQPVSTNNLMGFYQLYKSMGTPEDVDRAKAVWTQTTSYDPPAYMDRPMRANNDGVYAPHVAYRPPVPFSRFRDGDVLPEQGVARLEPYYFNPLPHTYYPGWEFR